MVQFPVLCKFYEHFLLVGDDKKDKRCFLHFPVPSVHSLRVLSLLVADNKRNDKCYIFLCDEMSVFLCL